MQGASREWGGWGQEKRRRKVCRGPVGSGGGMGSGEEEEEGMQGAK